MNSLAGIDIQLTELWKKGDETKPLPFLNPTTNSMHTTDSHTGNNLGGINE